MGAEGRVIATEISSSFLQHLQRRVASDGLSNVTLCRTESTDTVFQGVPDGSVDIAFICDVYHHFEYPESSLKSIYRAMRAGGKLVVVDFHREPDVSRERKQWLLGHIRAPLETFKQEIIDAGFQFEEEVAIEGFTENYLLRFSK